LVLLSEKCVIVFWRAIGEECGLVEENVHGGMVVAETKVCKVEDYVYVTKVQ